MGQFNLNDIGFARANNFLNAVLDQARLAGASGKGQAIICRPDGVGIQVSQTDRPGFLGWLSRSKADAAANNTTRDFFLTCLRVATGASDNAQLQSMLGADLKLADFSDKGRPLSAFRIKTIMAKAESLIGAEAARQRETQNTPAFSGLSAEAPAEVSFEPAEPKAEARPMDKDARAGMFIADMHAKLASCQGPQAKETLVRGIGEQLLAAPFARKPAESSDRLAEVLLAANHFFAETDGATISLDLAAEQYVLQRRVPLAPLDVDAFFALVGAFVNKLASFRALVADFRPVFDQAADASRKAQEESASMSFSGFMQV